jgi:hypothetical protein
MTAKTKTPSLPNVAKGEADKARACKFPRAVLLDLIRADASAEAAGIAALSAGIAERCSPDLYMDCAREAGKAVPLASAKVRASEINAAHGVAKVWGAKPTAEIIAAGCKLPGHKVRNALQALRVAKEAGKTDLPSGHQKRMAHFRAAWDAALKAADALKASRAEALKKGKAAPTGTSDGEPTGAEGNKFPKVVKLDDARATLVTLRSNAEAVRDQLASLPAAAFATKQARVLLLEGADTMVDLFTDALAKAD